MDLGRGRTIFSIGLRAVTILRVPYVTVLAAHQTLCYVNYIKALQTLGLSKGQSW
jgi:hypothetical protein